MLTDQKRGITVEAVQKELAELEATYKVQRRTKLALLRALQAEATSNAGDAVAASDSEDE